MKRNARKRLICLSLVTAILSSFGLIQAGGFLVVSTTGLFYRWIPGPPIAYNPDRGMLGMLSNTEAVKQVEESFSVWGRDSLATSALTFTNAGLLSIDVATMEDFSRFSQVDDDINPIIFDVDGSLFEDLGFPPGVIGFAAPEFITVSSPFFISEGIAVFNGRFIDGDASDGREIAPKDFGRVLAHEFGHFLNLDHTQINGHYFIGDTDDPGFITYGRPPIESITLMFPLFVANGSVVPLQDDIQAISTLYPGPGFPIDFGSIEGRIFASDSVALFQGANVIVRNANNPFFDASSNVSGDLFRPFASFPVGGVPDLDLRGFYRVNGLTNGESYTVEIVNVNARFADASSVGPFDTPKELPGPEEFWNGLGESAELTDEPLDFELVVANGAVSDVDIILNEAPFTIVLDKFDEDDVGFILSVQSLITAFDTPNGANDYAGVRFSIPASVGTPFTVTRAKFYNNDDQTVWPRVLLTTPNASDQPDLQNPLVEVTNVQGPAANFTPVPLGVERSSSEDLFLVIQFPEGDAISSPGSGGGPALGGDGNLDIGLRQFVVGNLFSTDGLEFEENIITFGQGSVPAANWAIMLEIVPGSTAPDPSEPNNDMASATSLSYGQTVSGTVDPVGDLDYFVFTGSAGDTIRANAAAFTLNSMIDGMLTLLNAAGDTIATHDDESDESLDPLLQAVLPASGDYFLVMESFDEDLGGPDFFYDLHLDTFSLPFEPNNTPEQATAIDTGLVVLEALDLPGDIDFFSFSGEAQAFVTIQLNLGGSSLDPVLTLFDTDRTTIILIEEGQTLQTRLPSTGTFFLAVADIAEGSGADFFYALRLLKSEPNLLPPTELSAIGGKDNVQLSWNVPVVLEIEPNNNIANAQEISGLPPVVVRGSAEVDDAGGLTLIDANGNPVDDLEDLFTITTQSPGLNVTLTDISSDLDLYLIRREGANLFLEGSSTNNGTTEESIAMPNLATNTYFIAVTIFDQAPSGPNVSPYTLTVDADLPAGGTTLQSYNLYRSETPGAVTTGQVVGNVNVSGSPAFTDTNLPANTFFYQVTAVYNFGESVPSNEISVVVTSVADNTSSLPAEYALNQNYPNPFNPSTVIQYALPVFHKNANVKLDIYNMLGQKVRTLVNKQQASGRYSVEWDGKNDAGKSVTSGLYVYRINAGTFVEVKKMLFIK